MQVAAAGLIRRSHPRREYSKQRVRAANTPRTLASLQSARQTRQLDSLGDVENIIEIAGFHGKDDWFYVKRYPDATVYAAEGHPHKVGVETDVVLNEDTKLPFPDARVFSFEAPVMPEHAIFIDRDGGILITGDAVQNMLDAQDCSLLGAAASYGMGFVHPVNIGPGWIMEQTKKGYTGPPLWEAFERLLEDVPFTQLLPSHGKPVTDGSAATGLRATLERIGRENLTGAPVEGRPKLLYILVAAVCVGTVWAVNTLSSAAAGGAGVGAGAEL